MEQLDPRTFSGAHPTNGAFLEQLSVWGFRRRRGEGVHLVFRGPHGGTVRVLRSPLGRPDPAVVGKAARLAGVSGAQFWAGPTPRDEDQPAAAAVDGPAPEEVHAAGAEHGCAADPAGAGPAPDAAGPERTGLAPGRRPAAATGDRIISQVLTAHTRADRPLGFEQVALICHGRLTRDQVAAASATLCRDGQLDRIRPSVYQWSGGRRATAAARTAAPDPLTPPAPAPACVPVPAPAAPVPAPSRPGAGPVGVAPAVTALFAQLFPSGIRMTAERLADLEQWAELTQKLAGYAPAP